MSLKLLRPTPRISQLYRAFIRPSARTTPVVVSFAQGPRLTKPSYYTTTASRNTTHITNMAASENYNSPSFTKLVVDTMRKK